MSHFNTSTTHSLITNSQQYMLQLKYVSIHSEDRDILKYPVSSSFEIELPQDYLNVQSIRLSSWTFPSNYKTFSKLQYNTELIFTINTPYNPIENGITDPLIIAIYRALNLHVSEPFITSIGEGFYNSTQMTTELTNVMNTTITEYIISYLETNDPTLVKDFIIMGGYKEFVVVYNVVTSKIWFGNKSSGFKLDNDSCLYTIDNIVKNTCCYNKNNLKEYINWGLPWYLGFTYCTIESLGVSPYYDGTLNYLQLPRFNYGDVLEGDNGYWLQPSFLNACVYFIEAPETINIFGNSFFYMEIAGMNNIDETSPFFISSFSKQTNITNGVVNSAFAKISVTTTPISQFYDYIQKPYKYYDPPAERIRRLFIKLRYHNGSPVIFDNCDFSFNLEFGLLVPHNERKMSIQVPEIIKYSY